LYCLKTLEKIESIHLFLLRALLNWGSGGGNWGGSGGSRGSNGIGLRVLNTLLQSLSLLENVVGSEGNGNEVLVGVQDDVREGREGWVVKTEGEGGNVGNSSGEGLEEILWGGREELGVVDNTFVIDVGQLQSIGEWTKVKHLHEGGLGRTDTLTFLAEMDISQDFDATSGNLGGNVEGGEERGLGWLEGGDLLWDDNVLRSEDSSLGLGRNTGLQKLLTERGAVFLGENESDVVLDGREDGFPLWVVDQLVLDGLSHESVLSQEDGGTTTETSTDLLHVVGANVIDGNHDGTWICLQEFHELLHVLFFLKLTFSRHLTKAFKG